MSEFWIIEREDQVRHLAQNLTERAQRREVVTLTLKVGRTRTSRQQAALEVWCRGVAQMFNEAGITREVHSSIFKGGSFECDWTRDSIKNEIWRPVQIALTNKESTTDPTTVEYGQIYETLVRVFGGKGIALPAWPVREQ